jgi:hypothetical protein
VPGVDPRQQVYHECVKYALRFAHKGIIRMENAHAPSLPFGLQRIKCVVQNPHRITLADDGTTGSAYLRWVGDSR